MNFVICILIYDPYVTQLDLTMDNFPLGFWTGKLFNIKLIVFRQMEHMKCQHFRQGNLLLLQQGRGGGVVNGGAESVATFHVNPIWARF